MLRALLALLAALIVAPAAASASPVAQRCMAGASLGEEFTHVSAQSQRWHCGSETWRGRDPSVFIRFTLQPGAGELPRSFVTRAARFSRIELVARDRDGASRHLTYGMDNVHGVTGGPWIVMPLPTVTAQTVEVVARIDEPWLANALGDARISSTEDGAAVSPVRLLFYAALAGLLITPLFLNLGFYQALREKFIIWHFAMVGCLLSQVLVGTGLINLFYVPPLWFTAFYSFFVYSVVCAAGLVFTAHFLEPEALDPRLRQALLRAAPWIVAVGFVLCLPIPALRPHAAMLYHISLVPFIVLVVASLWTAWRRGSRMVRFQLVGWGPPIIAGTYRIAVYIISNGTPDDALLIYNASLGIEMIATTLGTVSRLIILRRERDLARLEAIQLETVAARDPLTGLANRLMLESRFAQLYTEGFRTMAVLDIDHFKAINDQHGHRKGDEVLQAVAEALSPDEDCHVVRLGGEEFLLLLRGIDSAGAAERRRRAIPGRVARHVPGLNRPVTASMGMVVRTGALAMRAEFQDIYDHCDRLLYEAKSGGRNRTFSERVQGFASPGAIAATA